MQCTHLSKDAILKRGHRQEYLSSYRSKNNNLSAHWATWLVLSDLYVVVADLSDDIWYYFNETNSCGCPINDFTYRNVTDKKPQLLFSSAPQWFPELETTFLRFFLHIRELQRRKSLQGYAYKNWLNKLKYYNDKCFCGISQNRIIPPVFSIQLVRTFFLNQSMSVKKKILIPKMLENEILFTPTFPHKASKFWRGQSPSCEINYSLR